MQQDPRTGSTLELVVNEQQLRNMSQIDLTGAGTTTTTSATTNATNCNPTATGQNGSSNQQDHVFSLEGLKSLPARMGQSLSSKLDEAKARSDTKTEYVFELFQAFSGIFIWIICFLCTIIIPVILFFIGLANLDDCADRPSLPYLIFAIGFIMTASNLFNLALALDLPILANHQLLSSDVRNIIASILNIIFNCFVAFLYILSAYMVFTISKRQQNSETPNTTSDDGTGETLPIDCNGTLYNFTYWFISSTLGLFAILGLVAIILFAYNRYRLAIIRGSTPRSQQNVQANLGNPATNLGYSSTTNRL